MKVKSRIFYFDALRSLAILLVILIHISKWFVEVEVTGSPSWLFSEFLVVIATVGVPIFLMISGALLLNRDYGTISDFLKRRFSRIFYPFLFWIFITGFFKVVFMGHGVGLVDLSKIFFMEGYIWFIWMLIGVYLFLPIINSFIKEYSLRGVEYFLVIWIITIILNTLGYYPFMKIELSYFAGYLGYVVLGYYLTNKKFNISDKKLMIIGFLLFLIFSIISLITECVNISFIKTNYYLSIIVVLQSLGIFLLFKYFDKYCENNLNTLSSKLYSYIRNSWIGKCIFSISVCSYGIYLTHYIPIWCFQLIDKNIVPIFVRNPIKWIPLIFIVTILFSWSVIWVFSKIPYLKIVSGAN